MWIPRESYNRLVAAVSALTVELRDLRAELAGERAARGFAMQRLTELKAEHAREVEEFRRRLSIAQANFEWLTVSHNQANAERQAMFNSRMAVNLPPVQVEFSAPPSQREAPAEDRAAGQPYRPGRNGEPSPEDLTGQGLSFEDIGDAAAARLRLDGKIYDTFGALLDSIP